MPFLFDYRLTLSITVCTIDYWLTPSINEGTGFFTECNGKYVKAITEKNIPERIKLLIGLFQPTLNATTFVMILLTRIDGQPGVILSSACSDELITRGDKGELATCWLSLGNWQQNPPLAIKPAY